MISEDEYRLLPICLSCDKQFWPHEHERSDLCPVCLREKGIVRKLSLSELRERWRKEGLLDGSGEITSTDKVVQELGVLPSMPAQVLNPDSGAGGGEEIDPRQLLLPFGIVRQDSKNSLDISPEAYTVGGSKLQSGEKENIMTEIQTVESVKVPRSPSASVDFAAAGAAILLKRTKSLVPRIQAWDTSKLPVDVASELSTTLENLASCSEALVAVLDQVKNIDSGIRATTKNRIMKALKPGAKVKLSARATEYVKQLYPAADLDAITVVRGPINVGKELRVILALSPTETDAFAISSISSVA